MVQRFLLPCSNPDCAASSEIETSHAGRSIVCKKCQQTTEVPTLRGIRALEAVNGDETSPKTTERSTTVGVLFSIGLASAVICGLAGGVTYYNASKLVTEPPQEELKQVIEQFGAGVDARNTNELWDLWEKATPPGDWMASPFADDRVKAKIRKTFGNVLFGFAAIGVIVMIASIFMQPKRQR